MRRGQLIGKQNIMSILNLFLWLAIAALGRCSHLCRFQHLYNSTVQKVIDAACDRYPIRTSSIETTSFEQPLSSQLRPTQQPQPPPSPHPSQQPQPTPPNPSSLAPPAHPLPTLFLSNPAAPNWIFGDMTQKQYQSQLDRQKQNYIFKKCPLDKPFSLGDKCISCPDNQIFNLQARQCEECAPGTYFNQRQKACTFQPPLLYNSNIDSHPENYVGKPPDYDPEVSVCPASVPFTNYTSCVECKLPRYYDYNRLRCVECEKDQSFSLEEKRCVSDVVEPIEGRTRRVVKIVRRVPVAVDPIVVSVLRKQNGSEKQKGQTRAMATGRSSPQGQINPVVPPKNINPNLTPSYPTRYLTSPNAPNLLYGCKNPKQYLLEYESLKDEYPSCPQSHPYFNGKECISCPKQSPIFNMENKACIACQDGSYFDEKMHRCTRKQLQEQHKQKPKAEVSVQRFLMNIK